MTQQIPLPAMPRHATPVLRRASPRPPALLLALALAMGLTTSLIAPAIAADTDAANTDNEPATHPSLSVTSVQPRNATLPVRLAANGSVTAWQEAIVGAEIGGFRISKIHVDVGSVVRKGQVLADIAADSIEADIGQSQALMAEADATLAEAQANAERARQIADSGALSSQQITQYLTGATTAQARVASARAALDAQLLRLRHTKVVASDSGIISSRTATLGAVVGVGQELFRLIRQSRLEWRGEVVADEISRLRIGQTVTVTAHGLTPVVGKIRMIAPTVDPVSRNALVYVDLPATKNGQQSALRPGVFARGEFELGSTEAVTLPQGAIALRDGFSYAFRIGPIKDGQARITEVRLQLGRRVDGQIEVLSGLTLADRVVASGVSFLTDGDVVRVVQP